jgi:V8-like Glu-specific endopeptidase
MRPVRRRVRRNGIGRVALWLAISASATVALVGSAEASDPSRLHHANVAGSSASARADEFWTARRMKRATPLEVELTGSAPAPVRTEAMRSATQPFRIPPTEPAGNTPAVAEDIRTRAVFSSHEVLDPEAYPNTTNGAVFIKLRWGLASCSATALTSRSRSLVLTAGHCVHSGFGRSGHWLGRRWTFVPAYHDGRRPFGSFVAKELWTTDGWWRAENFNVDIGAAVLYRNARGQKVGNAVGMQGFATGLPRDQAYDAYGYPADAPYDGQTQWVCESQYAGDDPNGYLFPGPPPMGIGCDMTAGSSGGGWIAQDQFLNSLNSFGYVNDPDTMYGPYFGAVARALYKRVQPR